MSSSNAGTVPSLRQDFFILVLYHGYEPTNRLIAQSSGLLGAKLVVLWSDVWVQIAGH